MTELVEKHITRKLQSVTPAANKQLEVTEKQLRERVAEMQQGAQSLMDMIEKQIAERVSKLEPRITDAVHEAQNLLRKQLDQLQCEVQTSLSPIRTEVAVTTHDLHGKLTEMGHTAPEVEAEEPELHLSEQSGEKPLKDANSGAAAETIEDLDDEDLAARIVPVEGGDETSQQIVVHTPKPADKPARETGVSPAETEAGSGEDKAGEKGVEKAA